MLCRMNAYANKCQFRPTYCEEGEDARTVNVLDHVLDFGEYYTDDDADAPTAAPSVRFTDENPSGKTE